MTRTPDAETAPQPAPLKISRLFHARPALVFQAWSTAEHVKAWFSPAVFSVPQAKIDLNVGGAFEVCMRAPDGTEHWSRGTFVEVFPPHRLVVDMYATGQDGERLFRAYTEVDFVEVVGGTRMDVTQTYTFADPVRAAPMVAGAPVGWSQTLDKLQVEIDRMQGAGAIERSVVHATFHLERTYDAPVERVWRALSEEGAKAKWFGRADAQLTLLERRMDFRVGGSERLRGRWQGGVVSTFDATYHDIILERRIVYSYEMHLDDRKISVSLATMQLEPLSPGRTRLKVTEQGAFLDGYDDAGSREHGTGFLLDHLGASLTDEAV